MKVNIENLALCIDCTMVAVNGDYSGLDYSYTQEEAEQKTKDIDKGLEELSGLGHLCHSGQDPDEFSSRQCDCCRSRLAGAREFFHTLIA